MKFSKEFEGQLIPEWKEAFVDYWLLKRGLKRIRQCDDQPKDSFFSTLRKCSLLEHIKRERRVIQVHRRLAEGDLYETELMEQFADSDTAIEFFACLDSQLNKVNRFYRNMEREFLERGDSLRKQMEILLELKDELKRRKDKGTSCHDLMEDYTMSRPDEESESRDSPRSGEVGKSTRIDRQRMSLTRQTSDCKGKSFKIHIPLANPTDVLSAVRDELGNYRSSRKCENGKSKFHVIRKKLHRAEKMIRGAFIELYKGLGYLKTYRKLNMQAFAKILKKFDKVTNKQVLPVYLRVVESSYFNSSDKAWKLADEVEELFVKHFADDDRRKAMKYLKPTQKKESHVVTFFTGLFTGCFAALLVGYVVMACVTGMYRTSSDLMYMETVYPVLSMFCLMFLHLFLYGCNIVAWRKARINYNFIFDLSSPAKELKNRDVFLICSLSMAFVMGVLFTHLVLVAKGYSNNRVQAIPGLMLLSFILVLVCPFNVAYKPSRYRFLSVIRNIVLAPLYKVTMLDFFMADQLCSQAPMLRYMEYVGCYYITGSYKTHDYRYCTSAAYYRDLAYTVSFLPYYWRAMQCARRWFDEGHKTHLVNLGKYVSAMLAAGAKVAYEREKSIGWLYVFIVMSSAATLYQLYWDFVKDWGLLQLGSKNPWLRDELMLRQKFIYFVSMGLNLVLRLAWLQTVFHYNFEKVDHRVTMSFLAALEVVRRGQWNFFRLENEHLNNVEKFRAVKTVPLPFHDADAQD